MPTQKKNRGKILEKQIEKVGEKNKKQEKGDPT